MILRTGALVVSAIISVICALMAAAVYDFAHTPDEYGKNDAAGKVAFLYSTETPTVIVLSLVVAGGFYWAGSQATKRPLRMGAAVLLVGAFVSFVVSQI